MNEFEVDPDAGPKEVSTELPSAASALAPPSAEPSDGLPEDIEEIWGRNRLDTFGRLARTVALFLIKEWGEEKFRASKVHALAVETLARDKAKLEARKMGMDDLPPEPEPM